MQPRPLNILLIEHDAAFSRAVAGMLEQSREMVGSVAVVTSLPEAVKLLSEHSIDVVILEFFLPDGAGVPNISLLRETAPRVPVVVIAAEDDEMLALESVHAGAQEYLVKSQLNSRWLLRSIRYAMERQEADAALLAAEEKYRGIFDRLVEGIFQSSPEGRYLLVNSTLARIYGYSSPKELMQSVTDIGRRLYVQPGRREEFKRIMELHDTISGFESEIYRKDGTTIWISENCRAARDDKGKLLYYEGTVEDITQRRQTEENLRHSEALYHSLVETMPQSIFRKDLRGRYTFVNPEFCRMVGKKAEDVLGKSIYDFLPGELAEKREENDMLVVRTGRPLEQTEESKFPGHDHQIIHVIKLPIFDANGKVIGIQGMFWDITAQKMAEEKIRLANAELARSQEELRDSEALYHSLVETMPQNVFRKDREGRFTFANQQYCRHYHCTLEDILGKTDFDFFPRELAEKYKADDERVMTTGQTSEIIEEHHPLGQEKSVVQVVKTPLHSPGGAIVGLQGIFWDITAQKLAEEKIRQANAELARSQEELRVKNLQMQDDLKMAREIQLTMLPQQYPVLPRGATPAESAFHFTHRYHPTGTVGGDFFSVSALSDAEVAVFICDVAGHGVRSALVTAMVRALVEELRPHATDPGQFMTKLNSDLIAILKHSGTPVLTTAFYLVVDAATGAMRYANAGHPKPLQVQRATGKVDWLVNAGMKSQPALGLLEKATYQTSRVTLAPHDLVMLFTDGLYEVAAANQELYTQEMLATATQRLMKSPAAEMFDALLAEVRTFSANGEFDDDVCLVGMEYVGPGASQAGRRQTANTKCE